MVNWLLVKLGFDSYKDYTWFAHGNSTFAILVALVVWQSVPFAALTLYARARPPFPPSCTSRRGSTARRMADLPLVTFPILRPLFALITSLEVIWVFKCFAQIWAISKGGPDEATTTLPVYAFQIAQSLHKYDLGSAVSTLTVLILIAVLITHLRRMLKHEGEQAEAAPRPAQPRGPGVLAVSVFPVYWMVLTAFKPRPTSMSATPTFCRAPPLEHFTTAVGVHRLLDLLAQQPVVTGRGAARPGGRAARRLRGGPDARRGRRAFILMVFIAQMAPWEALLISMYIIARDTGMLDTLSMLTADLLHDHAAVHDRDPARLPRGDPGGAGGGRPVTAAAAARPSAGWCCRCWRRG